MVLPPAFNIEVIKLNTNRLNKLPQTSALSEKQWQVHR